MADITREKICFDEGWKFYLGDSESHSGVSFNDSGWKALTLPHDWSTEHPVDEKNPAGSGGGYEVGGIGWYRKKFTAPEGGGRLVLQFDGVFQDSTVFLNGEKVGGWAYGYNEFTVDISGKTVKGENVLAVRVDNSRLPNSRWYTGSGIYRNVYLLRLNDVHVKHNGLYIVTNGFYDDQTYARLQIQAWVQNESTKPVDVVVDHRFFGMDNYKAFIAI